MTPQRRIQPVLAYLVQRWLELRMCDDGRLAFQDGVHNKPCGAALAPFSPSPATDEAEEACPDLDGYGTQ
jgi:hypothetical protein